MLSTQCYGGSWLEDLHDAVVPGWVVEGYWRQPRTKLKAVKLHEEVDPEAQCVAYKRLYSIGHKKSAMKRKIPLLSLNVWMGSSDFQSFLLQYIIVLSICFEFMKKIATIFYNWRLLIFLPN
jgi:hypothetical protein